MDNEQQLRAMDSELQTLQAELGHLRHQFQVSRFYRVGDVEKVAGHLLLQGDISVCPS